MTNKNTLQEQLDEMVHLFNEQVSEMEQKLVDFALEHELRLYLGNYGNGGRSLILNDGHWSGKDRGDWVYSSESC